MHNKHKRARSIIAILCTSIVLLFALAMPVNAVISVSRGDGTDFNLSARSSFPMTVGFVYKSSPNSTYNYTLATDIGGYGQEFPKAYYGEDVVTYWYDELGNATEVVRRIDYQYGTPFVVSNGTYINQINGNKIGYYPIIISSDTPENPDQEVSSIVIRADDIFYNRAWLDLYEQGAGSFTLEQLGYCGIPTVHFSELLGSNEKLVGRININYDIQGADGIKEHVSFSYTVDTSSSNSNRPLLAVDNLLEYGVFENPRLLISNYSCFIDLDYYVNNGSWQKQESAYVNEINLTLPTYDTSGAYDSDESQLYAQQTFYSFPNSTAYVNSYNELSFEDVDLTSWLGNATKGFLDFHLWEGFTLGGLMAIIVAIPLVIWILKIFAGG